MAATAVYFGEAAGNRIFHYAGGNLGIFQFFPLFQTWDLTPAGEAGVIIARAVRWTFLASNGYTVTLTPIFDGITSQAYPYNGNTVGEVKIECQFTPPVRCSRVSVIANVLILTGEIEHRNLDLVYTALRSFPTG